MKADPCEAAPFRQVSDLEYSLGRLRGLLLGLLQLADGLDNRDQMDAIATIAELGLREHADAEKLRQEIERQLHPQREALATA